MSTSSEFATGPLPRLRRDLSLEVVAERGSGFPSVVVVDPVRGSYFKLGWPQSGVLLLWNDADTCQDLAIRLQQTYGLVLKNEHFAQVAEFLTSNQLSETDAHGTWRSYVHIFSNSKRGWPSKIAHNYLFFRVPLLHPDKVLKRLSPHVSFVFSRTFWICVALVAIVALHLSMRQWSSIESAAQDAISLNGLLTYTIALLGLKAVHELGHAFAATRYGCSVPTMGAAFMLGAPVLYTDTSDSWRLGRRAERLVIVFAGVAVEMVVAVLALLFWIFVDDGIFRQICFALASAAVIMSVVINLNPFMRYDGYFALSDVLQVPNLQARAFDLAAWRLRECFFKIGAPPPERFPAWKQKVLIAYAIGTAIYRFILYLSIVAVVYVVAGKALGIVLALFEVVVFIAMPIANEVKAWWGLRHKIVSSRRTKWSAASAAIAILLFVTPWIGSVSVPAIVVAEQEEALHFPIAAQLMRLSARTGTSVRVGDILFEARSPELERQLDKAHIQERHLMLQVARLHASEKEREQRVVLESRLAEARERVAALNRQLSQLVVRAPFDGMLVDIDLELSEGQWIAPKYQLGRVVSTAATIVRGLVAEQDANRIHVGASGAFVADDAASRRLEVQLVMKSDASDGRLPEIALSDRFGGSVPTGDERGEYRTRQGWIEAIFRIQIGHSGAMARGVVVLAAERKSPAGIIWQKIARVFVREQAF